MRLERREGAGVQVRLQVVRPVLHRRLELELRCLHLLLLLAAALGSRRRLGRHATLLSRRSRLPAAEAVVALALAPRRAAAPHPAPRVLLLLLLLALVVVVVAHVDGSLARAVLAVADERRGHHLRKGMRSARFLHDFGDGATPRQRVDGGRG